MATVEQVNVEVATPEVVAETKPTDNSSVFRIVEEANNAAEPWIAFEYYPPKTPNGVANLYDRLTRMKEHNPLYIDVTWGAGGTTSDLTVELCVEAQKRNGFVANMHLTCTNMPREKLDNALVEAKQLGIKNILALRGDPPVGQVDWKPVDSGFSCALDLVKYIKEKEGDYFGISVAGYPEGHPSNIKEVEDGRELSESEKARAVTIDGKVSVCSDADYADEMKYLKAKVDAGAGLIVTQMFYDVDCYFNFVKACREAGINVPIIPGIMCITAYGGFKKMQQFCKTRAPESLSKKMEELNAEGDDEKIKAFGVEFGIDMCKKIIESKVTPGLHFYTLNLEKVVDGILDGLNLGRAAAKAAAAVASEVQQ